MTGFQQTTNTPRASQNAQAFEKIGLLGDSESVGEALEAAGRDRTNVVETIENQFGRFVVKKSVISGPFGLFKARTIWKVNAERLTFSTLIPFK
jgi:hypothetical protein